MNPIGQKLRELRARQGVSQREMARLLGISHTRLRAYERGETAATGLPAVPRPELLRKVAAHCDYPYEALLELAGHPVVTVKPPGRVLADAGWRELEAIYRHLAPDRRHLLLELARVLKGAPTDDPAKGGSAYASGTAD